MSALVTQEIPVWNGEPLVGGCLLVTEARRPADTLQFARYLPLLRPLVRVPVVLACRSKLTRLLERDAGADQVIGSREERRALLRPPAARLPLSRLPKMFFSEMGTREESVPYLHAPEPERAAWEARMASETDLRVGIVWAASDRDRSCVLSDFAPLASVPGVHFFSLQTGAAARQAATPPQSLPLTDLSSHLSDFAEMAGAMLSLDLILSVDAAPAHLAGALGKPIWTLLSSTPDARWQPEGDTTPWYPTMRLFRQTRPGDWHDVFVRMTQSLHKLTDYLAT